MLRLILSNRWFAALWVLGVAFSASRFAGKGGEAEKALAKASSQSQASQQMQMQAEMRELETQAYRTEQDFGEGTDPKPDNPGW